jgi:hypothetical protein
VIDRTLSRFARSNTQSLQELATQREAWRFPNDRARERDREDTEGVSATVTPDPNNIPNHPPFYEIDLAGKNALQVIARNRDVPQIAAHEPLLRQRVERFDAVMEILKQHKMSLREALQGSERHANDLRRAWRTWCVHVQRDVPEFEVKDISIFEVKSVDAMLANVQDVITVIEAHRADLPYAEQALAELTTQHTAAATTHFALRDSRAALQNTQRELHIAASAVHEELVRLRYTLRVVLGVSHEDSRVLRARRTRSPVESEVDVDETSSTPGSAPSTPTSDGSSTPTAA